MTEDLRVRKVRFVDGKLYEAFLKLKEGKSDEKELYENLQKAIDALKKNPLCGIKIPSRNWAKEYVKKYGIKNLYKYDLPKGGRLIYTIAGDEIEIISILLEWFGHKEYAKRFRYKVS